MCRKRRRGAKVSSPHACAETSVNSAGQLAALSSSTDVFIYYDEVSRRSDAANEAAYVAQVGRFVICLACL